MKSMVLAAVLGVTGLTPPDAYQGVQLTSNASAQCVMQNRDKIRIPGGRATSWTMPRGASSVTFRGVNAVEQSKLTIYFNGRAVSLAGNGSRTIKADAGTEFTLSNDGNLLEFSVEVVWA